MKTFTPNSFASRIARAALGMSWSSSGRERKSTSVFRVPSRSKNKPTCPTFTRALLEKFFVEVDILLCGVFPGEVFRHSVPHDFLPLLRLLECLQRSLNSFEQFLCVVLLELEACSLASSAVILDGIVKASCRPDDRNRSIPHAVHLIQTARFVP